MARKNIRPSGQTFNRLFTAMPRLRKTWYGRKPGESKLARRIRRSRRPSWTRALTRQFAEKHVQVQNPR